MGQAAEIIRAVVAALEHRRGLLADDDLRGLVIDVKVNARTGEVRTVLISPSYEAVVGEGAPAKSLARSGRSGV